MEARIWGKGVVRPNPLGAQSSPGPPPRRGVNCQHQGWGQPAGAGWWEVACPRSSRPQWATLDRTQLPSASRGGAVDSLTGDKCREGLPAHPRETAFPGQGSMCAGGPVC